MINDAVLLEAVCAALVGSLARAELVPARGVLACRVHLIEASIQFDQKLGPGLLQTGCAAAGLSAHDQTSRQMTQPAAVLVLVAMLASRSSATEPLDLKIGIGSSSMRIMNGLTGRDDCDSDGGRVDSTTLLVGRHPLDAMAASLMVETFSSATRDLKDDGLMSGAPVRLDVGASCSSLALGQAQIGGRELGDELARIVTAFASADFQNSG